MTSCETDHTKGLGVFLIFVPLGFHMAYFFNSSIIIVSFYFYEKVGALCTKNAHSACSKLSSIHCTTAFFNRVSQLCLFSDLGMKLKLNQLNTMILLYGR